MINSVIIVCIYSLFITFITALLRWYRSMVMYFSSWTMITSATNDQISGVITSETWSYHCYITTSVKWPLNAILAHWSSSQWGQFWSNLSWRGSFLTQCSLASPSGEKSVSISRSHSSGWRWRSCGGTRWRGRPCGARPSLTPRRRPGSYHSQLSVPEDRPVN